MLDGIAGDSVDAGGGVDLLDAIDAAQIAGADLSGSGFGVGTDGAEGEDAAGAHAEHTADNALLAHAQAEEGVLVALGLEELHHRHIVREGGGGGDNLVEVGGDSEHFIERGLEVAGGAEVVGRDDEAGALAQAGEHFGLGLERAFEFEVDDLAAGLLGFVESG